MSTTITPADAARQELSDFQGRLIGPEDADYEQARAVFNAMIDRRPALIARCADADDVAAAVGFAREHGLLLAIRGGGHNGAGLGTCDDGVVIDLSLLKEIAGRSGGAHGPRRRRLHLGRGRPRHRRARPRDAERDHLDHRRRRAHPRRRPRPPHPEVRADDRQPARGRARARQRRAGARRTPTSIPTCSGRSGAAAATSASSPRSCSACTRSARSSAARPSGRSSRAPRSCRRTATSCRRPRAS